MHIYTNEKILLAQLLLNVSTNASAGVMLGVSW